MNRLELEISHTKNRAVISRYFSQGCLKASGILNADEGEFVYLIGLGGGLISGDEYYQEINLKQNAKISLKSQSNQKVYKSIDDKFALNFSKITLEDGAFLSYENDALIPYAESKLKQKSEIYLHKNSTLFFIDGICNGYSTDGLGFGFSELFLTSEFYLEGKLVLSDKNFFDKNSKNFGLFRAFKFNFFMLFYRDGFVLDDSLGLNLQNKDAVMSVSSPKNGFVVLRVLTNDESRAKQILKEAKDRINLKIK